MLYEHDIQKMFAGPKKKKRTLFHQIINNLLMFVGLFAVIFVIINFSAIYNIISYWYKTDIQLSKDQSTYAPTIVSSQSDDADIPKNKLPVIDENHLFIPKINVNAPISWDIANEDGPVQSALQKGVVNLKGTAHPGERGNVFVTGHSSNYLWAKGDFKNVFALLNKLVVGDLVYIKYKKNIYIFRADSINIVKPSDTKVLASGEGSYLTLMTCTPVGTSLNRLIVKAVQIDPNPERNINSTSITNQALPKGVR